MKLTLLKTILLFPIATIILIDCEKEEVKMNALLNSATYIEFDNFYLELKAFIWRDFMPGSSNTKISSMNSAQLVKHVR